MNGLHEALGELRHPATRLADWLRTACVLEAAARKPGNVHPGAAFHDLSYDDFLRSAEIVAPILAATRKLGLGRAILEAVSRTATDVGGNTNLGMILLLAPMAAVPLDVRLSQGLPDVLAAAGVDDSALVYRAIRLAQPGGMGAVGDQDLPDEPTLPLVEVMRLAAGRDRVAAQYAGGFRDVLDFAVPSLLAWSPRCRDWERAVIGLHLDLMAELPDTLIARKCGIDVAKEAARRSQVVLDSGWPEADEGVAAIRALDRWLRADGHRRNPGTTADLVAAALFAAIRDHGWRPDQFASPRPTGGDRQATPR